MRASDERSTTKANDIEKPVVNVVAEKEFKTFASLEHLPHKITIADICSPYISLFLTPNPNRSSID